jgi:ABC-type methionine transport system permease subunit
MIEILMGFISQESLISLWEANSWVPEALAIATWETIYMVAISTFFSYVMGSFW